MTLPPAVVAAALLIISLSFSSTAAIDESPGPAAAAAKPEVRNYIVRVQNDLKPSAFASVEQWYASAVRSVRSYLDDSQDEGNSNSNGQFLHVYKTVFHGFATRLTPQQAEQLRSVPGILGIFPDEFRQLTTTRTPHFLGLAGHRPRPALLTESDFGENVIIGVLDTGIAPGRRSFSDEGLGPIPARWKGECVPGEKFPKTLCNRKVIGARFFAAGYDASVGPNSTNVKSALDTAGHGTHTASTAAGRRVANASFFGFAAGTAVGMAPRARIAAYKVCWSEGCLNSDILAAFDKAVEDGVDVISLSVGGSAMPYFMDPIAIGAYGATQRGVLVSASAGNEGPDPKTITNVAPWITTVGASTIDRNFPADLVLGDGRILTGTSLYSGKPLPPNTLYPLYYGGGSDGSFSAATCQPGALDTNLVRGKIAICNRGGGPRVGKGKTVREAGGVGVVVANVAPLGEGLVTDSHLIPGLTVTEPAGDAVKRYAATNRSAAATIRVRGTQLDVQPAPVVAAFSARGPNPESLYVLKPDVVGPGVDILAAWPDGVPPSEIPGDTRSAEFNIVSGTSMSCPHVSGLAALLKGAHPDWSPAIIRSALMTTAYSRDRRGGPLLDQKSKKPATVWDFGAGHVDPEKALDPGLAYDLTADDYLRFLCNSNYSGESLRVIARRQVTCPTRPGKTWDLNYPSIAVVFDASRPSHSRGTVNRTVTHVSEGAANYTVAVASPKGVNVTVLPASLHFSGKGQRRSYLVKVAASKVDVPPGNSYTASGSLTWTDGRHRVTSPLLVVWQRPSDDN